MGHDPPQGVVALLGHAAQVVQHEAHRAVGVIDHAGGALVGGGVAVGRDQRSTHTLHRQRRGRRDGHAIDSLGYDPACRVVAPFLHRVGAVAVGTQGVAFAASRIVDPLRGARRPGQPAGHRARRQGTGTYLRQLRREHSGVHQGFPRGARHHAAGRIVEQLGHRATHVPGRIADDVDDEADTARGVVHLIGLQVTAIGGAEPGSDVLLGGRAVGQLGQQGRIQRHRWRVAAIAHLTASRIGEVLLQRTVGIDREAQAPGRIVDPIEPQVLVVHCREPAAHVGQLSRTGIEFGRQCTVQHQGRGVSARPGPPPGGVVAGFLYVARPIDAVAYPSGLVQHAPADPVVAGTADSDRGGTGPQLADQRRCQVHTIHVSAGADQASGTVVQALFDRTGEVDAVAQPAVVVIGQVAPGIGRALHAQCFELGQGGRVAQRGQLRGRQCLPGAAGGHQAAIGVIPVASQPAQRIDRVRLPVGFIVVIAGDRSGCIRATDDVVVAVIGVGRGQVEPASSRVEHFGGAPPQRVVDILRNGRRSGAVTFCHRDLSALRVIGEYRALVQSGRVLRHLCQPPFPVVAVAGHPSAGIGHRQLAPLPVVAIARGAVELARARVLDPLQQPPLRVVAELDTATTGIDRGHQQPAGIVSVG